MSFVQILLIKDLVAPGAPMFWVDRELLRNRDGWWVLPLRRHVPAWCVRMMDHKGSLQCHVLALCRAGEPTKARTHSHDWRLAEHDWDMGGEALYLLPFHALSLSCFSQSTSAGLAALGQLWVKVHFIELPINIPFVARIKWGWIWISWHGKVCSGKCTQARRHKLLLLSYEIRKPLLGM